MSAQNNLLKQVKVNLSGNNPASLRTESTSAFQPAGKSLLQSAINNTQQMNRQVNQLDGDKPVTRGVSVQQMFLKQKKDSVNRSIQQLNSLKPSKGLQNTTSDAFLFENPQPYAFGNFPVKDLSSNLDDFHPNLEAGLNSIQPQNQAARPLTRSFSRQSSLKSEKKKANLVSEISQPNIGMFELRQQNNPWQSQQQVQQRTSDQASAQWASASPLKVLNRNSRESIAQQSQGSGKVLSRQNSAKRTYTQAFQPPPCTAEVRFNLDQQYVNLADPNKRMRKNKDQMKILLEEFDRCPKWSYEQSVKIGAKIGMTFHQVSKWNWDQRKKRGIPTERIKAPKK